MKAIPTRDEIKINEAIQGIESTLSHAVKTLKLDGADMSVTDILKQLKNYSAIYARVRVAEAEREQAMLARSRVEGQAARLMKDLSLALAYVYGKQNIELTKFGFKPLKTRSKLTSQALAERTERQRATRQANGTKGPKQKRAAERTNETTPRITGKPANGAAA